MSENANLKPCREPFQARGRFIFAGPTEHDAMVGEVYDNGQPYPEEMAQVWAASYCTMFPALARIRNMARDAYGCGSADARALLRKAGIIAGEALPVPTIGDVNGTTPPPPSSPTPPGMPAVTADQHGGLTDAELRARMRDPSYWRDRDPSTVAKVADGFQRLTGNVSAPPPAPGGDAVREALQAALPILAYSAGLQAAKRGETDCASAEHAYELAKAALSLPQAQEAQGWRPIGEAPKEPGMIEVRSVCTYRWKPYSPSSEQFRSGVVGRWQRPDQYLGWENARIPENAEFRPVIVTHQAVTPGTAANGEW